MQSKGVEAQITLSLSSELTALAERNGWLNKITQILQALIDLESKYVIYSLDKCKGDQDTVIKML